MSDKRPVVLVTGASRGLGKGIALELAAAGLSVVINYARNKEAAESAEAECRRSAISDDQMFLPVQANVADAEDRRKMLEQVRDKLGSLDALVNNAGVAPRVRADITEATEESFAELIKTNLQGPYFLTQAVARQWLEKPGASRLPGGPKIVFVTSISAYTASVSRGDYCISKAGLTMARQLWATRLADEGIGVYEVRPGIMATDMTSGVQAKYDTLIAEGLVPQKRWGTAKDVGRAVTALLRGDFPFSTGTVIDVDGGFQLRRL